MARNLTRLGKGATKKVHGAIEDLFEKAKARLLGPQALGKRIYVTYDRSLSLPGVYEAGSMEEYTKPDLDVLESLIKVAGAYIDAHMERTKARVIHEINGALAEARHKGGMSQDDFRVVLNTKMADVWADVTKNIHTIVDTEVAHAKNVSVLDGILGANLNAGIDDPVVYFVVVRDQYLCDECKRIHLLDDGVTPRLWYLSEVGHGYHKKGEENPKIGGLHPHCRCTLVTLLPSYGFGRDGKVKYVKRGHLEIEKQRRLERSELQKKENMEVGAGAILYAKDTGRFLLGHRSARVFDPNCWGTFGGFVDDKEKIAESAEREIREELGYEGPIKLIKLFVAEKPELDYHNYLGVVDKEFEPKLNWENKDAKWVERDEWPTPRHPGLSALLKHPRFKEEVEKLSESELSKSIKNIKPGTPMGPSWAPGIDYSHLLSPEHRAAGYKMHLTVEPDDNPDSMRHAVLEANLVKQTPPKWTKEQVEAHIQDKFKNAYWYDNRTNRTIKMTQASPEEQQSWLKYMRDNMAQHTRPLDKIVGHALAYVNTDNSLTPHFNDGIDKEHRGMGFGKMLYSALFAHAHQMGANTVMGGYHSVEAGRVHEALSRQHGMEYKAHTYNAGEDKEAEEALHTLRNWNYAPNATQVRGPYKYTIKEELRPDKPKLPRMSCRQPPVGD